MRSKGRSNHAILTDGLLSNNCLKMSHSAWLQFINGITGFWFEMKYNLLPGEERK